jgi:hypothetical protein
VTNFRLTTIAVIFICALALCSQHVSAQHRLIVEVSPMDIHARRSDEMPASVGLDWKQILTDAKLNGKVDFDSIRVTRIDAKGNAVVFGKTTDDKPTAERPFRWYDADIPDPFPAFNDALNRTDGKLKPRPAARAGYLYQTSGRGEKGTLGFIHTQTGNAPSRYAIDFTLLPANAVVTTNGPRGWIGDGQLRCAPLSETTTGGGHTRIALDDWNEDGLTDIIQGDETGTLFVFLNTGTKNEPRFAGRSFILDAQGQPIDVGTHAAPLVVDFDADGKKDLLVGTYQNRITFFKNVGANNDRKLIYKGVLMADGKPLELPMLPLGGGASEDIFKRDYYPILDAVDWNGDGKIDLLAGGYVTGRVYLLENIGNNADGTMKLRNAGPIEADGKPINVGDWCAAPCAADFNGDGKLDLITGRQPFSKESQKDDTFLRYYQSSGSSLVEMPIPAQGAFPATGLATPRAADLNGDGLLDLVVSARQNIYIFFNRGTQTAPKFAAHSNPILIPWGSDPLLGRLFIDYNHDGLADTFTGYRVFINTGQISPFAFLPPRELLPRGMSINHPSGIGDDWFWPLMSDLDKDGNFDILFGDWYGTIWFHRNNGTDAKPDFDLAGHRLQTIDGTDVTVGPIGGDASKNFDALQGARTEFAVDDVDGDGLPDLVIGDTYGIVRYFKNAGSLQGPKFAPAIEVGSVKNRCSVDTLDFDGDGRRDIIAGGANGAVRVFRNIGEKGNARFDEGIDPKLPPLKQPRVHIVDLNHDGDDDLFVPSLQGSVWIERSFLEHGYAKGKLISLDSQQR